MEISNSSGYKHYEGKEDIQMGLDLDNAQSIMSLLRNNIYSDPIESWVREIFSNGVDAHARCNNTKDFVEVDIVENTGLNEFVVRDYGASMDKDTIRNVYALMGKSDKRSGNNEMGGWGLGAKSPLAYTDNFHIETWTQEDGQYFYRKWVQYIDSTRIGKLTLLQEDIIEEVPTGTKVTVPFKQEDFKTVVSAANKYISYCKSKVKALYPAFEPSRIEYNTYGKGWAMNHIVDEYRSWSYVNKDDGIAVIGDIPYRINIPTLYKYFKNNSLSHVVQDRYAKHGVATSQENFHKFLNGLRGYQFEIELNIGDCDLSASREDLQYTTKTCSRLYNALFSMFLEYAKYLEMDLIYHPKFPDAVFNYKNEYGGSMKHYLLCDLKWYREDIGFSTEPSIFNSNIIMAKKYQLNTVWQKKGYKDVIRGYDTYKLGGNCKYTVLITQDTEYKNYSKFLKYQLMQLSDEDKYHTCYIVVEKDQMHRVFDWIKETYEFINLSDFVADYKANCTVTTQNSSTVKKGEFKALVYKGSIYRDKAESIGCAFDYDHVSKEPDEPHYYILADEFKQRAEEEFNFGYSRHMWKQLNSYLESKNIDYNQLVYTKKLTRNFNHENWINFLDVVKDDIETNTPFLDNYVETMFRYSLVKGQMNALIKFVGEDLAHPNGAYMSLRSKYEEAFNFINDSQTGVGPIFALCDERVRNMWTHINRTYYNYEYNALGFLGTAESNCQEIMMEHINYFTKYPLLRNLNNDRQPRNDTMFSDYMQYIDVMEAHYGETEVVDKKSLKREDILSSEWNDLVEYITSKHQEQ